MMHIIDIIMEKNILWTFLQAQTVDLGLEARSIKYMQLTSYRKSVVY